MKKHVLITGASSGVGKATGLKLSQRGYMVHAGVRKEKDFEEITKLNNPNFLPIMIDVSQKESILEAKKELEQRLNGDGLFALLNNAGTNYIAPVEFADELQMRKVMDTNVFGVINTTQAMIPLLLDFTQKSPSLNPRILVTSSVGGIIGLPWESIYHVSKFAVNGFCQSLRYELSGLNIEVSALCPGGIITDFFEKSLVTGRQSTNNLPNDANPYYVKNLNHLDSMAGMLLKTSISADAMAEKFILYFEKKSLKARYVLGKDSNAMVMIYNFSKSLFDMTIKKTFIVK